MLNWLPFLQRKNCRIRINFNSTNDEVKKVIQTEANAAFDRTYQILKTRIDKFGVTQPNVQKLGNGRILVELPGIKEPDRVRKLFKELLNLNFGKPMITQRFIRYWKRRTKFLKRFLLQSKALILQCRACSSR